MATQKTAPNTWEDVFRLGSVVDISVQYWTGTEGLDPSAMGVELPEALQRSLRLTSKRLLPAAAFQEFSESRTPSTACVRGARDDSRSIGGSSRKGCFSRRS